MKLPFALNNNFGNELAEDSDLADTRSHASLGNTEEDPLQQLLLVKKSHFKQGILMHLTINSLKNKFEELKLINEQLKASTETKIDSIYPDSQFRLQNYRYIATTE